MAPSVFTDPSPTFRSTALKRFFSLAHYSGNGSTRRPERTDCANTNMLCLEVPKAPEPLEHKDSKLVDVM